MWLNVLPRAKCNCQGSTELIYEVSWVCSLSVASGTSICISALTSDISLGGVEERRAVNGLLDEQGMTDMSPQQFDR